MTLGLTQLATQLVSRIDTARLDSQIATEERLQAVHRELQQQFEMLRANLQESLGDRRRELFGMVTALQQGVEQRLSDNITQHSTLFREMAEKLGEIRVTNERIVAISHDINQLRAYFNRESCWDPVGRRCLSRAARPRGARTRPGAASGV